MFTQDFVQNNNKKKEKKKIFLEFFVKWEVSVCTETYL